ncbi:hypothetical protein PANA5342_pPANA10169 (plasmid) [Pantoea ananatis LMG 5342]|nr:hypothetical protein PANA5342_pPANA10169 [Pantoea ananatis LMG 5342]
MTENKGKTATNDAFGWTSLQVHHSQCGFYRQGIIF